MQFCTCLRYRGADHNQRASIEQFNELRRKLSRQFVSASRVEQCGDKLCIVEAGCCNLGNKSVLSCNPLLDSSNCHRRCLIGRERRVLALLSEPCGN